MQENVIEQHTMFSNPVWSIGVDSHHKYEKNYIETLNAYREKTSNLNKRHHRTFITSNDLHHNTAFGNLVEDLTLISSKMKEIWMLEDGTKIGIQQMWGSITQPGGILMPHQVPFTFLYGMYFLKTPPLSGNLVVDNPTYDANFFATLAINQTNTFNTPKFSFPMPQGHIVLLPGHLDLHTTMNDDEEDRYIIHFSLVIVK